jgi:hypothetical protein
MWYMANMINMAQGTNMCHVHIPLKNHGGCVDVPRFNICFRIYRSVLSVQSIMCSICQLKFYCMKASCCTPRIKRGLEYHIVNTDKQLCYRQLWVEESDKRQKKHQSACLSSHEVHPLSAHVALMVCQLLPDVLFHCISLYINEDVTWKIRENNL